MILITVATLVAVFVCFLMFDADGFWGLVEGSIIGLMSYCILWVFAACMYNINQCSSHVYTISHYIEDGSSGSSDSSDSSGSERVVQVREENGKLSYIFKEQGKTTHIHDGNIADIEWGPAGRKSKIIRSYKWQPAIDWLAFGLGNTVETGRRLVLAEGSLKIY